MVQALLRIARWMAAAHDRWCAATSACRVTGYESHLVTGQSEPAVAAVP